MKALISPQENNRIAEVAEHDFPIAEPLYWVDCPSNCTTEWVYSDSVFIEPQGPSQEEIFAQAVEAIRQALQSAIDFRAQGHGFSCGNALMLYAGFVNQFQTLAQTFAAWESSVWYEAEQYKQEVIAGTKPMLTPEQAVALMPAYPL